MIIYLVRHGQTTGDVENRYGGDYDDHLTELGKQQAAEVAERLTGKQIELLYASPRVRAQEAAGIIGGKLGLEAKTLENFRERNGYGVMTGMVKEEAAKQYPQYVKGLKEDVHYTVEGAEHYDHFRQRIIGALQELAKTPAECVAVVTHGGPIRLIFREILKLGEITIDDCAYVVLKAEGNRYQPLEYRGITLLRQKS